MKNPDTLQILLVEDDEVDARAVKRGLTKNKIFNPVTLARDGCEALDYLRGENGKERIPRPYVILLDLNMPRMNGIEFLKAIRGDAGLSKSIIFVLTTSQDDRDRSAAYDNHVAGYITKSEAGRDFLNLVQMLERFVIVVQFPPED